LSVKMTIKLFLNFIVKFYLFSHRVIELLNQNAKMLELVNKCIIKS